MIERVLVPVDGSEMATRALRYALEVHDDADMTVLFVAGEPSPMMGQAIRIALESDVTEAAQELAEDVFEASRSIAAEYDREIDTVVGLGSPAREIIARADDYDAIVLGSHGGDLRSSLYMGNVAKKVSNKAPVPVTVVR